MALSSEDLAECWKEGMMSLEFAVTEHWKLVGLWPVDKHLTNSIDFVIGFANLGLMNTLVQVDEYFDMTVEEIIERFQLSAFIG
jgi:hypothetical protein